MAGYIKVTLEHHLNRRYHAIKHAAGRRPALTFGRFNLRYREPKLGGRRIRVPLAAGDLNAALEARRKKEIELRADSSPQRSSRTLTRVAAKFLAEIQATRKKKTHAAYRTALTYFIKAVGDKSIDKSPAITCWTSACTYVTKRNNNPGASGTNSATSWDFSGNMA
jgi:hypothetical protein